jgi:MFS family permease
LATILVASESIFTRAMTGLLRPVSALLLATAILLLGSGLIGILLPVRGDLEGFSTFEIGALGAFYYGGLMLGCFVAPQLIARVGHIRAFTACTALVTIAPLAHALDQTPVTWCVLRLFHGACFAGLFMVIESWLSDSAGAETRGRILAVYTVVHLTVATLGMQMIGLADIEKLTLFIYVAILFSLAAVPVALTRMAAPPVPQAAGLHPRTLFAISPAALFSSLMAGLSNSAVWTLMTVYGKAVGLSPNEAAAILAVVVLAGAAAQWPAGHYSDRIGRRPMLTGLTLGAAMASAGLVVEGGKSDVVVFVLAGLLGACSFSIYPLSVAHGNDLVSREKVVETSGGLLLAFSAAAILGPLLGASAIELLGGRGLFVHTAVVHVLLAGVLLVRIGQRSELPGAEKEVFVPLPRTTPALFELDPRTDGNSTAEGAAS